MERLGTGFTLVSINGDPSTIAALRAEADVLGVPLDFIDMPVTAQTVDWDTDLIVLRPDRFVAGVGESLKDSRALSVFAGLA